MCHIMSQCVTLLNVMSQCVTIRHVASPCFTTCHISSQCVTFHHYLSHCVTTHQGVTRCVSISHVVASENVSNQYTLSFFHSPQANEKRHKKQMSKKKKKVESISKLPCVPKQTFFSVKTQQLITTN